MTIAVKMLIMHDSKFLVAIPFERYTSKPIKQYAKVVIGIYLVATMISSIISYFILELTGYKHSLGIAVLIFIGGLAITTFRWRAKGKDYLLKRYQEIPKTILERKEHAENE